MGVGRTLRGALLFAALGLIAPASAAADATLAPSGALIYSWHGDAARGCAREGVCGIQGVLIIRPQNSVDVLSQGHRSAALFLNTTNSTVRVRRTDVGSQGNCIDTAVWPSTGNGAINVTWAGDGSVRATMGGAPSSGRCAGPLDRDLGHLALRGRRTGGRHPTFDLRESVPFTAGPYSGTLVSTLRFVPARVPNWGLFSSSGFGSGSSSSSSSSSPPGRSTRMEGLQLTYRVSFAPGALTVDFRGQANPLCDPFDACGTRGVVSLAVGATRGTVMLFGTRVAPRHVNRREALRAFAAGRFSTLFPTRAPTIPVRTSETLSRPAAPTCTDRRAGSIAAMLGLPFPSPARGRIPLRLSAPGPLLDGVSSDVLRTHCAGPDGVDVLGVTSVLAQASVARQALLARHTTVAFTARGGFATAAYAGFRVGTVNATLTLESVSVNTFTEFGP
jgi:hypothetical protein